MRRGGSGAGWARCDVTAARLAGRGLLLAGIGSNVAIFNKCTRELVHFGRALMGQRVYGFTPRDDAVIVRGGKQIRVLSVSPQSDSRVEVSNLAGLECDDWILDTIWMDDDRIALLTTHNVVQIWDVNKSELITKHVSRLNSILYSGLLQRLYDDVLVFAGTVFSKVIVHRCGSVVPLFTLEGHKGVIFSITWDAEKELIATTSDDRSVRIWSNDSKPNTLPSHKEYWEHCLFTCKHTLYGHLSRILKCAITKENIISVGEDSFICFWDLNGRLLKKLNAHQNGPIWSVDADSTHIVTGGSDSGIILHPLTAGIDQNSRSEPIDLNENYDSPKKIIFTSRGNIFTYTINDNLCYHDVVTHKWQLVSSYDNTYKMFSISSCKQMLCVIDSNGNLDIFVEDYEDGTVSKFYCNKLDLGRVCSAQWAGNRHLVLCNSEGRLTVIGSDMNEFCNFVLPACKEQWLTSAAVDSTCKIFVLGDRCGNLHFYSIGQKEPVKSFKKIHGNIGPSTITFKDSNVVTTGRDGTIKYFSVIAKESVRIKLMNQIHLPFDWIEKFIDKEHNVICGFHERNFIVFNIKECRTILDIRCGGGHRAWNVNRCYNKVGKDFKEFITFVFVKDSSMNVARFQIDEISSKTIVRGSHVKEINCLEMITPDIDVENKEVFYIAGGEDTTLRISSRFVNSEDLNFSDRVIFKQLSNTRTIAYTHLTANEILLISGGGRANISVKVINFKKHHNEVYIEAENVTEYLAKGTDKERRSNNSWRNVVVDLDPETRIMSLQIVEAGRNVYIIIAGCSDSVLRLFKYRHKEDATLKLLTEIKWHKTCILNVHSLKYNNKDLAFSMTTTGEICLWDLTSIVKHSIDDINELSKIKPVSTVNVNRSGINGFAATILENCILIATGGDDNYIHLLLLKFNGEFKEVNRWSTDRWHCAQITGLKFTGGFLISASIDQRVTLSRWSVVKNVIECTFVDQFYTDIADVQGIRVGQRCRNSISICVYGKGIETMDIPL